MSELKITGIEPVVCGSYPFVKVYTDGGITGIGENVVQHPGILRGEIDYLKKLLIGEDPFDIERLWVKMYSNIRFSYAMPMISGIDMALWDIKAKALGVPVYELLGGLFRSKVRVYPHLRGTWNSYPDEKADKMFAEPWGGVDYSLEEIAGFARALVREGYTAMKFDPFKPGIDGYHGYRPSEIDAAAERVAAIRAAVGNDVDLMVECHGKFNAGVAIKIGRKFEPYGLMWLEEPVPAELVQSMKKVSGHVNIPIALGERMNSKRELKQYLEEGIPDVMMFDLGKIGGLTEAMKVCAMCEAYQVKVAPHNPFGPVAAIASVHLAAAVPSFLILEHEEMAPWAIAPEIKIVDGYIEVPAAPGFGVELNEDEISKHQSRIEDGTYKPPVMDRQVTAPAL